MSALPLFDLLLSSNHLTGGTGESAELGRAVRWAAELVEESLAQVGHIRGMDKDLGSASENGVFDRQAAALLQGAYEDWRNGAEALLSRIKRIERKGVSVQGSKSLRDECGRVSAMLQVTLDELDEAAEQVRRGEVFTIAEVRRELLAQDRC